MSRNENVCVHMCLTIRKRRMRSKRDWLTQQGRQKEKEEKKKKRRRRRSRKNRDEDFLVEFSFFSPTLFISYRDRLDIQLDRLILTLKVRFLLGKKTCLLTIILLSSKRK